MIKRVNTRRTYQLLIFFLSALLVFPMNISAKRKTKGAQLTIISDGIISGELLEVRENSLLILHSETQTATNVEFSKINKILIKRKSMIGKGTLYGLLIGTSSGILYGSTQTYGVLDTHGRTNNAMVHGVIFGFLGCGLGLIGGTVVTLKGKYKEIYNKEKSISNLDEIAIKLNKKARYPNIIKKTKKVPGK